MRPLILALSLLAVSALAADTPRLPRIPSKSLAEKKELLFSDNFDGSEHDAKWHRVVDTFAFADGALEDTQTRVKDEPSRDGDEMRVTIDDKPVAYLKSPGIGHPTKSKIELGVAGQSGWFDDIKVWNAAPAK